ncbi:MAG: nitroreductase family deazaflavin-dependent oxidoreductase [Novosphingobium sp.]|nr:nitroreductase family deazaflavin-dependent oxidoreductase [Novosphingobium sp.]
MTNERVTMRDVERRQLGVIDEHTRAYLESGGREGHIFDSTSVGGHSFLTTMLLETVGRKSGQRRITALNYGDIGGEVVIVASKGGADIHPAWFLNLREMDEVTIQIATEAFRARWREPEGDERERVWAFIDDVFPPYANYRKITERRIPLIMLRPVARTDILRP